MTMNIRVHLKYILNCVMGAIICMIVFGGSAFAGSGTAGDPFTSLGDAHNAPSSGRYYFNLGSGLFQADVDTAHGGGWVLVMQYHRAANTQPNQRIIGVAQNLPINDNRGLGTHNANDYNRWGHTGRDAIRQWGYIDIELRLYGATNDHNRIVNFYTDVGDEYLRSESSSATMDGISTNFVPLPGHTAFLPAEQTQTESWQKNPGDGALTDHLLYANEFRRPERVGYVWLLGDHSSSGNARWEMDNNYYETGMEDDFATIHKAWLRANPNPTIVRDVDFSSSTTTVSSAQIGSTVSFAHQVTNSGNDTDTINFGLTNGSFPSGTSFNLYRSNGVTPLTDTDSDGKVDTGSLSAGASYNMIVKATIPANASTSSSTVTYSLVASSSEDNSVTATATGRLNQITKINPQLNFAGFNANPPASGAGSCAAPFSSLVQAKTVTQKGRYCFDLGNGTFLADVDTAEGGGWVQILQYIHKSGTTRTLRTVGATSDLPSTVAPVFGEDGSTNSNAWGNAGAAAIQQFFDAGTTDIETRWYGEASNHDRVMHFYTTEGDSYMRTGSGNFNGIRTNFTPLTGHSAYLPAAAAYYVSNRGNESLTYYPFYSSAYRWTVINSRWNMDTNVSGNTLDTHHRVWIRDTAEPAALDISTSASDNNSGLNANAYANNGVASAFEIGQLGDTVSIPFYIENDGAAADSFNLAIGQSYVSGTLGGLPSGWSAVFKNTQGNVVTTTPSLAAGASFSGVVEITLPGNAASITENRSFTLDSAGTNSVDANGDGDGDYGFFLKATSARNAAFSDIMLVAVDAALRSTQVDFAGFNPNPPASGAGSCAQPFPSLAHAKTVTQKGRYCFDLGDGTFLADVDTAEGGGWVLVLQYIHRGGTNPSSSLIGATSNLPRTSNAALGDDESLNTTTWGHTNNAAIQQFFDAGTTDIETRFYGEASDHNRLFHIITDVGDDYMRTGAGNFDGIDLDYVSLSGNMVTPADYAGEDWGDWALSNTPFVTQNESWGGGYGQWSAGSLEAGGNHFWAVDHVYDVSTLFAFDTHQRVWIRDKADPSALDISATASDNNSSLKADVYGLDGVASAYQAGSPGGTVSLPFYIENDESAADSFSLAIGQSYIGGVLGGMPAGWSAVFKDSGGNIVTATPSLAGGASFEGSVEITLPSDAAQITGDRTFTIDDNGTNTVDANGDGDGDYGFFLKATSARNANISDVLLVAVDAIPRRKKVDFSGFSPSAPASGPGSCAQPFSSLADARNAAQKGRYCFDLGNGQFLADVDTSGAGGWVQVLQYIHKGGTNPSVNVIGATANLPTTYDAEFGDDGSSNSSTWGHAGNAAIQQFFDAGSTDIETRWYGETDAHDDVVYFYSTVGDDYLRTGIGSFSGLQNDHTVVYPGSSSIAADSVSFTSNAGNYAMNDLPFGATGAEWIAGYQGGATRYFVATDNASNGGDYAASTHHRVWIRDISVVAAADVYNLVPAGSTQTQIDLGSIGTLRQEVRNSGTVADDVLISVDSSAVPEWGAAIWVDTTGDEEFDAPLSTSAVGTSVYVRTNAGYVTRSLAAPNTINLQPDDSLPYGLRIVVPSNALAGQTAQVDVVLAASDGAVGITNYRLSSSITSTDRSGITLVKSLALDADCSGLTTNDLSPETAFITSKLHVKPGECAVNQVIATNNNTTDVQDLSLSDYSTNFAPIQPNSLRYCIGDAGYSILASCTFTTLSDSSGDDEGEVSANSLRMILGGGSTPSSSTTLPAGQSVTLRYTTRVQ